MVRRDADTIALASCITFVSEGANIGGFNLKASASTYGLGKAIAGAVLGTGLMPAILPGANGIIQVIIYIFKNTSEDH